MMEKPEQMPAVAAAFLILVLVFGPIAIGQVQELPQLKAIGYSVFIGVIIAFLGFAKSSNPNEQFSPDKLVITPITGLFAGIVMAFWQLDYSSAFVWMANTGVLTWIEFVGKAIVRRLWAPTNASLERPYFE